MKIDKIEGIFRIMQIVVYLLVPVISWWLTNRSSKKESIFVSYLLLQDEKFVSKKQLKNIILCVLWVGMQILFLVEIVIFKDKLENVNKILWLETINSAIVVICLCGCEYILKFENVKYLDTKLEARSGSRVVSDTIRNSFIIGLTVALIIWAGSNGNEIQKVLFACFLIIILLEIEMLSNFLIFRYARKHLLYHVKKINIVVKSDNKCYEKISNYKKKGSFLEFGYIDNDEVKQIAVPVNEVKSIEKIIDPTAPLGDHGGENKKKMNNKRHYNGIKFMIVENKAIFICGIIAAIYCLIYMRNTSEQFSYIQSLEELLFNIAISVIAATVFYIMQVFIPNRRRRKIQRGYAVKYLKLTFLKEYFVFEKIISSIVCGEKMEREVMESLQIHCKMIEKALNTCISYYGEILSDELLETIQNLMLEDDFFYNVRKYSDGVLKGTTLSNIINDTLSRKTFEDKIDKITIEIKKME